MGSEIITPEQIEDFVAALKAAGFSIRKFCRTLANAEYQLVGEEYDAAVEKWRQRFKRKAMSAFEFQIMLDVLEKQPQYKSSNLLRVSKISNTFTDTDFQKSLLATFKSLK